MIDKPDVFPGLRVLWANLKMQVARDAVKEVPLATQTGSAYRKSMVSRKVTGQYLICFDTL